MGSFGLSEKCVMNEAKDAFFGMVDKEIVLLGLRVLFVEFW